MNSYKTVLDHLIIIRCHKHLTLHSDLTGSNDSWPTVSGLKIIRFLRVRLSSAAPQEAVTRKWVIQCAWSCSAALASKIKSELFEIWQTRKIDNRKINIQRLVNFCCFSGRFAQRSFTGVSRTRVSAWAMENNVIPGNWFLDLSILNEKRRVCAGLRIHRDCRPALVPHPEQIPSPPALLKGFFPFAWSFLTLSGLIVRPSIAYILDGANKFIGKSGVQLEFEGAGSPQIVWNLVSHPQHGVVPALGHVQPSAQLGRREAGQTSGPRQFSPHRCSSKNEVVRSPRIQPKSCGSQNHLLFAEHFEQRSLFRTLGVHDWRGFHSSLSSVRGYLQF